MIQSLLKKYILPKEVDFISTLGEHSRLINNMINELYLCFIQDDETSCKAIVDDEFQAQAIREKNMSALLNTFITPIDRESIYRVISQLDWIAVSVRHFVLEAKAYEIVHLEDGYSEILGCMKEQSYALDLGFINLQNKKPLEVARNAQGVRDGYEKLVEVHIQKMAALSKSNNLKDMFVEKELLSQLKEIGKRLQICANSLEDIVIKMS